MEESNIPSEDPTNPPSGEETGSSLNNDPLIEPSSDAVSASEGTQTGSDTPLEPSPAEETVALTQSAPPIESGSDVVAASEEIQAETDNPITPSFAQETVTPTKIDSAPEPGSDTASEENQTESENPINPPSNEETGSPPSNDPPGEPSSNVVAASQSVSLFRNLKEVEQGLTGVFSTPGEKHPLSLLKHLSEHLAELSLESYQLRPDQVLALLNDRITRFMERYNNLTTEQEAQAARTVYYTLANLCKSLKTQQDKWNVELHTRKEAIVIQHVLYYLNTMASPIQRAITNYEQNRGQDDADYPEGIS